MMYASKIKINYNPEKVRYHREVELPDGLLTLEDISKHLKDGEKFSFEEKETGRFGSSMLMNISGFRDETEEEMKARIAKQESYNQKYEDFHAKYSKK